MSTNYFPIKKIVHNNRIEIPLKIIHIGLMAIRVKDCSLSNQKEEGPGVIRRRLLAVRWEFVLSAEKEKNERKKFKICRPAVSVQDPLEVILNSNF